MAEIVTCRNCTGNFEIANEDFAFYRKISVPPPTHCPTCRLQRRMAFRNEKNLYRRTCDFCKKAIISIYSSDKPFTVYCQDCWWSDKWDCAAVGRDFDFSKNFFEQYLALRKETPRLALMNRNPENSEYCNYAGYNKNCYLAVGGSWYNEDCLYGRRFAKCRSSIDCESLKNSELCYEVVWGSNLYNCVEIFNSMSCSDCYFSISLKGCDHCLFCSNLRNKSFHVFNKPVKKEEFERTIDAFGSFTSFARMLEEFRRLRLDTVYAPYNHINCIACSGDYLENCKNVKFAYDIFDGEDCKYVVQAEGVKDIMDCTATGYDQPQLFYEMVNAGNGGYNNKFSFSSWNCSDIAYCDTVMNSRSCFGCVNMNRKQFCILNKQYSEQEYEALVSRIAQHMKCTGEFGEFFPISCSPFAYNESLANDYFPFTKEQANQKKYQKQIYEIPDNIKDVPESIVDEVLACMKCGKNYRVVAFELKLYLKLNVPIPRKCPTCRYLERLKSRNPPQLWQRNCAKCGASMQSSFSPERSENVYCEQCYLASIY